MSTWTSKVRLGLATALILAAMGAAADEPTVKVAPPKGFCISEGSGTTGLVLMGTCAGMKGAAAAPGGQPAILTAMIGPQGSGAPIEGQGAALQAFFSSSQGRAALSRSGRAGSVQVLQTAVIADADRGEVFILRVRDVTPFPGGQATEDYWRALLPLGDRMVTLTVLGLVAQPLEPKAGLALLRDFVAAMRRANRRL